MEVNVHDRQTMRRSTRVVKPETKQSIADKTPFSFAIASSALQTHENEISPPRYATSVHSYWRGRRRGDSRFSRHSSQPVTEQSSERRHHRMRRSRRRQYG